MDLTSPNLKLSYLAPAQAQKHVTHNEALRQLDALVQLSALSISNTPLTAPENGDRQIVGLNPEGAFAGQDNKLAAFQDGAWAFFTPQLGWQAYIADQAEFYMFDGASWQSPNTQQTDMLGINSSADAVNRLAVKSSATLFDHEGGGHNFKINKSESSKTASQLFQTNYVSKAEIGLIGDDKLQLKVSSDGNHFKESFIADSETGSVSFPYGTNIEKIGTSVEDSGGVGFHYGIPSVSVSYFGRQNLSLSQGRVYFCPIYIDRPTKVVGGLIAQYGASTTPGAVIRAGIFKLGQANGNNWSIGERVGDFGTHPADIAGHKEFETQSPSFLEAGWYACAVGTNGAGVGVRNIRTLQSGQCFLVKSGSAAGADLRFCGAANHLYTNNVVSEIETGFPESWSTNIFDLLTVQPYGYLPFIPKWEAWDI